MIYLDNAATTPLSANVLECTKKAYNEYYGNSASSHEFGLKSKKMVQDVRYEISNMFGCNQESIYFTSGATEASNTILRGYADFLKFNPSAPNEIIISALEHPCVYDTVFFLEHIGFKIITVPVDSNGLIDQDSLLEKVNEKTAIVSIMWVNNETGTIQDINNIASIVKNKNKKILFMTDMVQAVGKIPINVNTDCIDAFIVSGHKFGTIKGTGFFYLNPKYRILPLMYGGGQENGYRPGTTNTSGIYLFYEGLKSAIKNQKDNLNLAEDLNIYLEQKLKDSRIEYKRNIDFQYSSPFIFSVSMIGKYARKIESDLSKSDIFVSTRSACTSNSHKKSRILESIGLNDSRIEETLRISFYQQNFRSEIDSFVEKLKYIQ